MQKAEQTITKIAQNGNKFKQKPNLSDAENSDAQKMEKMNKYLSEKV